MKMILQKSYIQQLRKIATNSRTYGVGIFQYVFDTVISHFVILISLIPLTYYNGFPRTQNK
jgi:hypothetical protein